MGCDIYIAIQKRVDDQWQDVPWTSADKLTFREDDLRASAINMPEQFDWRNYNLFAILANVRNATWGPPLTPIAEPRGLPADYYYSYTNDYKGWLGDHSFSYVTVRELLDYPWDNTYEYDAYVQPSEAAKLADGKTPDCWSAYSSTGVRAKWTTTIRKATHNWPDIILPVLLTIGPPEDVRLVFGFDS